MKKSFLLSLGWTVLALNGAYLYAYNSPTLFYIANVLFHLGLGVVVLALFGLFLKSSFQGLGPIGRISALTLMLGGWLGLVLVYTGTTQTFRPLLTAHILMCVVGLLLLLVHLIMRKQAWPVLAAVLLAALAIALGLGDSVQFSTIENPLQVPVSMEEEGGGSSSLFYPSPSDTSTGDLIPSEFFMTSESCGRSGCHPDIYAQWKSSAHHLASFNNQWYRKSIEYMQEVVGTEPAKWCAGCHDHALLFSGMMDRPVAEIIEKPEAHVGLSCISCHSISHVRNTTGNGGFVIEFPPLHYLASSHNPVLRYLHDFVVELDPGPHRMTFMKPFMRDQTAEYCSACHKVHLDVPVNDYRWIRGFNEYDGWQSSGVSGQGARSFYYPEQPMDCADCHMPLIASEDAGNVGGVVHDHRFPGANTAIAFANRNSEQQTLVTDFLRNGQVSVDIFALSEVAEDAGETIPTAARENLQVASTFAEGDEMGFAVSGRGAGYTAAREVIAPIDRARPVVQRGESVRVDAVVRTKNVGHFFPGGTVDAFDVWVELKVADENGKIVFWSGFVPPDESGNDGPVDPGAHFYRSLMLDEHGNRIDKRNAWATRSVAYVRLIPPGAADTVHFRLDIPEDAGDVLHLSAKVNYRKFSWWNTHFSYAGVRDPEAGVPDFSSSYDDGSWVFTGDTSDVSGQMKKIPDLPIVTMAEAEAELRVVDAGATLPKGESVLDRADLVRWNDYGIGLLLQGDLRAAEEIFTRVTEIDPEFADGWINVGRSRILEGRADEAQEVLNRALEIDPSLARTQFFLGMTYKSQGDYDTALVYFRQAEVQYPRDRVVLNQIGRILFLQRKFEESVRVLNRVIAIDPEDLQAHYNLMLCYRALKDTEKAKREQALYLRFKADESAQSIAGPYLREHPEDNNERQAIHEHVTYPLDGILAEEASDY
jgi:tetratricopeptide (TPR) repeat protein